MKIIICDDEKIYIDSVKQNVDAFLEENDLGAEYTLYTDCTELIKGNNDFFDMAFLDIEMGEIKGTQVAEKLKEVNPNIIVFIITSHDDYLDEAMDLDVFRYIKKPLDVKRLYSGLDKAIRLLDETVIEFYLKNDDAVKKVNSNDILYVEIIKHGTKVVTLNDEYVSKNDINYWSEMLSASFFYQVHSSFIINMKHITKYKRDVITLNDKYNVPVSSRNQVAFKRYLMKYIGGR